MKTLGLILFLTTSVCAAGTNDAPVKLSFDLLKSWTHNESNKTPIPEPITRLDGKRVEREGVSAGAVHVGLLLR
jgi:hypothetical protein